MNRVVDSIMLRVIQPRLGKMSGEVPLPATRTVTTGSFMLDLGGQFVPVKSIEGGAAVGVVVGSPAGASPFREKHLAGVHYEPIAIAASFGSARPLFEWIRTAWQGTLVQKTGAVIRVGARAFPVGIEFGGIPNRCRLGESGEIDLSGELNRCRGRIPRTCVSVRLKRLKAERRGGR